MSYKIEVTETYKYLVDIQAENDKKALKKVKAEYKNGESGVFVCFCGRCDKYCRYQIKVLKP